MREIPSQRQETQYEKEKREFRIRCLRALYGNMDPFTSNIHDKPNKNETD